LYDFGGKRIELVGVITLPTSFDTPHNPKTEYITFDVVIMHYPYNTIIGRGLLNTCIATLPSGHLCLKVLTTFRIISIFGSQKDGTNIEQGFAPGYKNVHFVIEESEQYQQLAYSIDTKASTELKKAIETNGDIRKVVLDT
jgi:hypothetical protein